MGFFSRFFKLREQDPDSLDTTWDVEHNGSELVLDDEYAHMLMTEIHIDAAIASLENWRQMLHDVVHRRSSRQLQPELVCQDDHCELGRWLHGAGRLRLGGYPAFGMLVARHRYFHQQAGEMLRLHQAGEQQQALLLLNGSCRHAGNQVVLLLKELRRSLDR